MKVLMFGWEFPPLSSGGLGTACYGLTKALSRQNISIALVLHTTSENNSKSKFTADFLKIIAADDESFPITLTGIKSPLHPYMTSQEYIQTMMRTKNGSQGRQIYGENLFAEVQRYSLKAASIAKKQKHDVIRCHDWMTFRAGIEAKKISGKPLVVHVHATEFDRTGGNGVNQCVYDIEREWMRSADSVIAVSNYTKRKIIENYGVDPKKIRVVHNAVDYSDEPQSQENYGLRSTDKIVLFLGRITLQKGPDYFIEAAKKVLSHEPNVTFVIAGSGDMEYSMIDRVAALGLSGRMLFTGFLKGKDIDRAYRMADLYVMPSVSEPFGITPLEALKNGTPVLISKQSGVSEVLSHCLKVDFWDTDQMANQIISVLRYSSLKEVLSENGGTEVRRMSWDESARKCVEIYEGLGGGS